MCHAPPRLKEAALALLRTLDSPARAAGLGALVPQLSADGACLRARAGAQETPSPYANDAAERRWLAEEGLVVLVDAEDGPTCERLTRAIDALVNEGYPATFVYAFDEPWRLGERLRARVSDLVGARYALVADAWAWRIAPGRGRGWPPHRGLAAPRLDRSAPELVNVWVALTDAGAERSCMHFVPLAEDPGYPDRMDRLDAPLDRARAVPVSAGTALAWNANVLHWGGPCSARAAGPRISCSFTLCRDDADKALGLSPVVLADLDFAARLDLLAQQIVTYGRGQPDVAAEVLEWATATMVLREAARREP